MAAKMTRELATVEKPVEIALKVSARRDHHEIGGLSSLEPLTVHAAERTLKTLQMIKENHDKISQQDLLLIMEEVVEFRSREVARLFQVSSLQYKKREEIDKVINEVFLFC